METFQINIRFSSLHCGPDNYKKRNPDCFT